MSFLTKILAEVCKRAQVLLKRSRTKGSWKKCIIVSPKPTFER